MRNGASWLPGSKLHGHVADNVSGTLRQNEERHRGLSKPQLLQAFSGCWRSYRAGRGDYKSGSSACVGTLPIDGSVFVERCMRK